MPRKSKSVRDRSPTRSVSTELSPVFTTKNLPVCTPEKEPWLRFLTSTGFFSPFPERHNELFDKLKTLIQILENLGYREINGVYCYKGINGEHHRFVLKDGYVMVRWKYRQIEPVEWSVCENKFSHIHPLARIERRYIDFEQFKKAFEADAKYLLY